MDHYFTIDKTSTAEFKDRGSRFIAYAYPVIDTGVFKSYLQALKKEHPKAVHHCFAYRLGTAGDNFRVSDDGEPSGTAGKPILGQLDSKNLTNAAVIVVRYFGGTLLGVPGLINAYKTAAALALQVIPIVKKQIEITYTLHFDYTLLSEVMRVVKKYNCNILKQDIQLFSLMYIGIPQRCLQQVLDKLKDIRNVEFSLLL